MRGFGDDEPQRVRLVDLTVDIRVETPRAWRVFDGKTEAWLPKSLAEDNGDGTFTLPEWLALEKALV